MSIGYLTHGLHSSISATANERMEKAAVGMKPPEEVGQRDKWDEKRAAVGHHRTE